MKSLFAFILVLLFTACKTDYEKNLEEWGLQDGQNVVTVERAGHTTSIRFNDRQRFVEPDTLAYGGIDRLVVDQHNRVIIADDANAQLHVYNSEGQYIQRIGRRGSGPGEFQSISAARVYNDELFVMDPAQQRISVFQASGGAEGAYDFYEMVGIDTNVNQPTGFFPVLFYVIHSDEWLIGASDSFRNIPDSGYRKVHYYRLFRNGEIDEERVFAHKAAEHLLNGPRENPTIFSFPHLGKPLFDVSEKYIYSGWSEKGIIHLFNHSGDKIRSIVLLVEPQPLPTVEIPELVGDDLDPSVERARENVLQEHPLPDSWPVLNDLLVDDENRLWVSTIVEDADIYEWWVLEQTGELISRFEWPRDQSIVVIKDGKIYSRETDEDTGLQQVVRYRVEIN